MSVRKKMDFLPTKGLAESSHDCNQKNNMIGKNILTGKGYGVSEGESRNNEDVNRFPAEVVENQAIVHSQRQRQWQQQQCQAPQGPIVRWENFLHVRSLKVLLVENDDSTRHVVSALLRNCSYEVRAMSNGLEAWKFLEDRTNHVDFVLTEVAMPGVSGIDLLSKITSHKTCKNIPVIMMSSNDSMRVVFKCLSNGAVDFLVKPIRKNELKNLWQHVWRKCHSSSGSESGIRTQKSPKSRSVSVSDNNTDSNDAENSESSGLICRNGSDDDSGTQTSCSKRALEVQTQPVLQWDDLADSPRDDLADSPSSTCAQVIHSRPEAQRSNWVPTNITKLVQNEGDKPDNVEMGKDLMIGVPTNSDVQLRKRTDKVEGEVSSTGMGRPLDLDVKEFKKLLGKNAGEHSIETAKDGMKHNRNDVNATANVSIQRAGNAQNEATSDVPKVTKVKHMDSRDKKDSSLELSLQKLKDAGSFGTNVLRHSDHSAFSRYITTSATNLALTGNIGSCSPVNYSLEAPKTESMPHVQCNSTGTPNQVSDGSSNNIDMGSTTNNTSTNPESLNDKSIPRSTFQPVHHSHCPPAECAQTIMPGIADTSKMVATQAMPMHQHDQVEHHHYHHYHHHHHHVHSSQQQQQLPPLDSDDSSSRNLVAATSHCVPSEKLGLGIEGNATNYASASESNNGSSVQNGKSTAGIAEGTNDNGAPGACATGSESRNGLNQDRLALREAALNKFRQKRKERCFEKKVRYQSRKMLAEQRPRVRGQFVRQAVDGNRIKDECNDTNS